MQYISFFVILKNAFFGTIQDQTLDIEWENFKKDYDKVYENESIESFRYEISKTFFLFKFFEILKLRFLFVL